MDDTAFPKNGNQENCCVALRLSVAAWNSSLPIAYRLYLPEERAEDAARREKAEAPEEVRLQTEPEIAMDQIRAAVAAGVAGGVVLADAGYGISTEFRDGPTELGLPGYEYYARWHRPFFGMTRDRAFLARGWRPSSGNRHA